MNNRCDLAAVYDLFNREVEVSDKISTGPRLDIGPENVTLFSVPMSCPHLGRVQVFEFLKLKCLRSCSYNVHCSSVVDTAVDTANETRNV